MLLIFVTRGFGSVSKLFIGGICEVALALAAKNMTRVTLHSFIMMLLMSGWYFVVLLSRASVANLSLQYVNLINCMMNSGVGFPRGG